VSTILKALRRLESERATPTDGRPLREAVAAAEPLSHAPRRRRWTPLASLVVGVAVGATALLLWPRGGPSPPAEVESPELAASRTPTRGAQAPRGASVAVPPARQDRPASLVGPPPQAFASDVAVVPRPVPSPRLADPPATGRALAAGATEQSAALSGPDEALEPDTGAQTEIAPPQQVAPTRPVAEPTRHARAGDVSGAPAESPVAPSPRSHARVEPEASVAPRASDEGPALPEERAAEPIDEGSAHATDSPAPERTEGVASESSAEPGVIEPSQIRVEKTLWHPRAERRVAVVTLPEHEGPLRVREGEVVGETLVSKIEPSGVVFTGAKGEVRRAVGAP
jgi:hypothetical protein